jgi:hypothetical protein
MQRACEKAESEENQMFKLFFGTVPDDPNGELHIV